MTFYFLLLFGLYFVLLLFLRWGWEKAFRLQEKTRHKNETLFISIIIPFRNEEDSLTPLLTSLSGLDYDRLSFEIILVDDHSTDHSVVVLEVLKKNFKNLTLVSLGENEFGKKAALTSGIRKAKGEIIATTDADCFLPPNWLASINFVFQAPEVNMVVGIVAIGKSPSYFARWQAMEFASVIGTGVAAFGWSRPLMCNGANLSFRKDKFMVLNGYEGNEHIASGDDEFLMRKILSKYPDTVRLLTSDDSVVVTKPQPSVEDFLHQRIRWAGKWKSNPLGWAKLLAVFIFLVQASWILTWIYFLAGNYSLAILVVFLKIGADIFFLLPVIRFLNIKFRILPFMGLQFLYPFYVLIVGLFSPWFSYKWKGRRGF